jgi:hypothetical protein
MLPRSGERISKHRYGWRLRAKHTRPIEADSQSDVDQERQVRTLLIPVIRALRMPGHETSTTSSMA